MCTPPPRRSCVGMKNSPFKTNGNSKLRPQKKIQSPEPITVKRNLKISIDQHINLEASVGQNKRALPKSLRLHFFSPNLFLCLRSTFDFSRRWRRYFKNLGFESFRCCLKYSKTPFHGSKKFWSGDSGIVLLVTQHSRGYCNSDKSSKLAWFSLWPITRNSEQNAHTHTHTRDEDCKNPRPSVRNSIIFKHKFSWGGGTTSLNVERTEFEILGDPSAASTLCSSEINEKFSHYAHAQLCRHGEKLVMATSQNRKKKHVLLSDCSSNNQNQ